MINTSWQQGSSSVQTAQPRGLVGSQNGVYAMQRRPASGSNLSSTSQNAFNDLSNMPLINEYSFMMDGHSSVGYYVIP